VIKHAAAFAIPFFLWTIPANALRPVVPAKIALVTQEGVGYVTWSGTDVINAQVGRWDAPYPYPPGGPQPPVPGLEPEGFSTLNIDVDVNDGGYVTFRYKFKTYDAGIWDWLDIRLETPTGSIPIQANYGKPGDIYGNYWEGSSISFSRDISEWQNQRVRFVISVRQDGWGDQTQTEITGFQVTTCQTPPLTPIADFGPEAVEFEGRNTPYTAPDRFHLGTALACLQNAVPAASNPTLRSAYRPTGYQRHLREVWDTWGDINGRREPECRVLRQKVQREMGRNGHSLAFQPAVGSLHESGQAFDLSISGLSSAAIDAAADGCGLRRFSPRRDPNHFSPR
jgi:hypothetical protein